MAIKLTDDQKKEVRDQLKGLDGDELSDDAAKAKFEKLWDDVLQKDQKTILEEAGYRPPGQGGGGRGGGGGVGVAVAVVAADGAAPAGGVDRNRPPTPSRPRRTATT